MLTLLKKNTFVNFLDQLQASGNIRAVDKLIINPSAILLFNNLIGVIDLILHEPSISELTILQSNTIGSKGSLKELMNYI
jgi:hypothetical protein